MRLGILGGGQLGLMLAEAASLVGVSCTLLDPSGDAPAGRAGELLEGAYDDPGMLATLARTCDVATYEFENVPVAAARRLAELIPTYPPPVALEVAQDRLSEKSMFERLGIATPGFAPVDGIDDLRGAVEALGLPVVLKTRRGGYDGKGQAVLHTDADLDAAWESLGGVPLLAEEHVAFERELSILAVAGADGTAVYPIVENTHVEGILRRSVAPAPDLSELATAQAERAVRGILRELDYRGVIALELFQVGNDVLANEMAPRVHNSGHWTIEGATTSQFENHVRAVVGLPLGSTDMSGTAGMVNCVGSMPDPSAIDAVADAHLHDYGKAPRPGRKLGHVTVTAADRPTLDARLHRLDEAIEPT